MSYSTLLYPSFFSSPNPNPNALRFSHSSIFHSSRLIFSGLPKLGANVVKKRTPLNCFAAQQPHNEGTPSKGWESWILHGAISPERILRVIAGATSSPICQFIESPRTFLHSVDPRIKLVGFLSFRNCFALKFLACIGVFRLNLFAGL